MKIGLHTQALHSRHSLRGIGFYTKNLLEEFKIIPDLEIEEFSSIDELEDVDLVHYPYFDFFKRTLPNRKKFPTVVTIHDVTPLVFPKHYPPGIRGRANYIFQKQSLKSVKQVITDSVYSKSDIQKYLKVSGNKIKPVYLAPAAHFRPLTDRHLLDNIQKKYQLPKQFVLFTGSVNWNKNILGICEAALKADIDLVLVGKDFENRDNLNHPELESFVKFLIQYADNPKIHILGFVPDEDFVGVINLARIGLLPSFYEGFGLPILEYQACGLPVITGNVSSMPEIAGPGAILVDPYQVDKIASAITDLLSDNHLIRKLIEQGKQNVLSYSWKKTARETIDIYKSILDN